MMLLHPQNGHGLSAYVLEYRKSSASGFSGIGPGVLAHSCSVIGKVSLLIGGFFENRTIGHKHINALRSYVYSVSITEGEVKPRGGVG
jgi:hypothetical protein